MTDSDARQRLAQVARLLLASHRRLQQKKKGRSADAGAADRPSTGKGCGSDANAQLTT